MKIKTFSLLFAACLVLAGLAAAHAQDQAAAQQPQQNISPAQAFAVLKAEADKGNNGAILTLGTMYERGIGTPRDFAMAFQHYSRAAAAGMAEGYYNTGVCYEVGMGTSGSADPKNAVLAFQNFEKSAEHGLNQGLYKLASLYINGIGTAKNEAWGVELLGRAAAAGHAGAGNDLGVIHFEGNFGQPKDINKAFDWFSRSAELGNGEAMKNLAVFFRDGVGRPADPGQELKWYALARLAGYPAGPLSVAIEEVKKKMTQEQIDKIEAEAQAWVKAFQERELAKRPQQQPVQ